MAVWWDNAMLDLLIPPGVVEQVTRFRCECGMQGKEIRGKKKKVSVIQC